MVRKMFGLLCIVFCGTGLYAQLVLSAGVAARIGGQKIGGNGDSITLVVRMPPGKTLATPHRLLQSYEPAGLQLVRVAAQQAAALQQEQGAQYIDLAHAPKEEVTTGSMDLTLNRLNFAHQQFPGIRGQGIRLSIKEQAFDTSDIDYRNRYFLTAIEAPSNTTHAALMATIAAGAGNSSPQATGAAPAGRLHSSSFFNLLPDADSLFARQGISVQNHSYGTIVENRYGLEAMAYDLQVWNNPSLLHVFSSGNSGTAAGTGPYAGLAGRGNLTGNFKYAKNVLTVGAVDSFGKVPALSSRGPSFDGRIKPEIVAFGEDGSSGAAALASGTAALVQQAYREKFSQSPTAALVKAVLINSAVSSHGGVNHLSGWGNLDGWAALKTVNEARCSTFTLSKGGQIAIPIVVPEQTRSIKVTISWTDTAAAVDTATALINDVNAMVTGNGGQWLPWVLSARRDSLNLPVVRGIDSVNNTEQISIAFPAAGVYQLVLDGGKIKTATQTVAIAWQLDTAAAFLFTYPAPNEPATIGENIMLRWSTALRGKGTLQWSNGGAWQTIGADVDLDRGYHYWLPSGNAGLAQVRMVANNGDVFNSGSFVLSNTTSLNVGFQCADSVLLTWKAAGNGGYRLYQLGQQYMEPLATVQDTFVVLRPPAGSSRIYSIAPLVAGKPGIRSAALSIAGSGTGCYIKGFFVQEKGTDWVALRAQLGTLYGLSKIRLQQWVPGAGFATIQTIPAMDVNISFTDSSLLSGINRYRLELVLQNGATAYSEEVDVYQFVPLPVMAYPNPVSRNGSFTLVTELPGKYTAEMYDLQGKLITKWVLQNQITVVPVRYNAGLYFLCIQSDDGVAGVIKLIVY